MHRSSESIANLAAALAKAQAELVNPENRFKRPFTPTDAEALIRPSATRRYQAASISCARR
jgi:hypothetical protein